MHIYQSALQLIGCTPLVEIKSYNLNRGILLFAKLEFMNPGSSVKDRVGKALIEKAIEFGWLTPGERLQQVMLG